ncbi:MULTISPECIES: thermosome subunit beta [unclassified Methanosarcina]|uniref:thermosome subunit beta n=1 Tax=unclassified Methanosarcina TaxID=2644672 RepID=UPI000615B0E8|nr:MULTISPECIES: thermosome subunit beta [unclassified Methanosarcina]AKB20208.1 Heat shock protein 60 family chaperone GroEL [Methanosarcina sp. WWM596]AKB23404.1 Heat shock protein 60 family chaperone GroEL [Methanosarcina sp. WH1]
MAGQPIFILKEGSKRTRGRDAQSNNIMAAKAVAEAVRTTLGPKGMDKMLVDSMGDVVITNDGATILKEMDIEHPAAKMVVEVAKTQDDEVGDGTTSAAVVAGELLKKAEDLIEQEIHPTIIASGYRLAAEKAVEVLNSLAMNVDMSNRDLLVSIAETAMTGKGAEASKRLLSEIAVDAVTSVVDTNGKKTVDRENISVIKKVGGRVEDSELIQGMIIDKERIHSNMPEKVKDAKLLLLNSAIELKDTEVDAEISITSPDQLQSFLDQEEQMLKKTVQKVIGSGANVVFCQKGIEDLAQHYLAKAGIFAIRRVKKSDMEKLARATGGKLITNLDEVIPEDLGYAGLVEEKKVGGDNMTFVTGCNNPKAVTILLRGGTEHVVDSIDSALEDALRVVGVAIEDEKLVAGGGSPEVEVALRLQEYAATLEGREQLAVKAYAEALEVIPRTLAENAGLDPIDMLMELRSQHEKGMKTAGLDVYEGKVVDMWKNFVVEPLRVKTQVINAATESAVMILRIDDIIASTRAAPGPEEMGGGMPPGMGGMPQGMGGMGGMPPGMM